ncbi:transglycosylase domain-containing protein [Sinomonas mesophila]|uniref:transglycosylase domain-containing protein n=1 Tax=Sinomonas mesophila TaxID=1531955 RepID=UPI000987204F|nr:transglycosylase domain-containing protein [Sinomonas mesophila]
MASGKNPVFDTATTLGKILAFLGVSAICGVLVAGLMVPAAAVTGSAANGSVQFFESLPGELTVDSPGQVTRVLAADGSEIATLFAENRTHVPLDAMSQNMKDAIIAIEDSRFYEHGGVDTTGILRAVAANLSGNRQGASTLTQQYVTNVINEALIAQGKDSDVVLNGQKGVGDKLREMKLAIALEKQYSKDEILEGYLNIVFFNRNAYGIQAASQYFFSVDAKDLSIPQAALLAGLVNSPTLYNPEINPDNALARRNLVIDAMLMHGKINQQQHDEAIATPIELKLSPPKQGCAYAQQAQYFCDYVLHTILNDPAYGPTADEREKKVFRGGLTIKTTLDPRLQGPAQARVDATAGENPDKWGGSLLTIEPGTGKVLAMAQNSRMLPGQGSNFTTTYNFNVDRKDSNGNELGGAGGFQPGSTMKPFTFAAWLTEGKSATQTIDASRRVYPLNYAWRTTCNRVTGAFNSGEEGLGAAPTLQNNDEGYYRAMPINYGLYNSINTATYATAAGLNDFCDIQRIVDAVQLHNGEGKDKLDMSTLSSLLGPYNVSPMSMASAFAVFASNGTYCSPMAVTEVTDIKGQKIGGQAPSCQQNVIKPDVAKGVNFTLQDVLVRGSGYQLKPGVPAAAKTGTNNFNSQTWLLGYTTGLVTASFFGEALQDPGARLGRNVNINGKFYKVVDGALIAGPQWADYMAQVARLYRVDPFEAPPQSMTQGAQPQNTAPASPSPSGQTPTPQPSQAPSQPAATSPGRGNGNGNG